MLAGCLVNGILSVIGVDVISVSSTPTLKRSDGKIQNREEEDGDGHSSDGKIGFA